MAVLTERLHKKRLGCKKTVITTDYYDKDGGKRRKSDGSVCDDVRNGVVLKKTYETNGRQVYYETEFNPGIKFTFLFDTKGKSQMICPNCGSGGTVDEYTDGCPYCGTYFNIDYDAKELGTRRHSDYAVYRKKTVSFGLLFCVLPWVILGSLYVAFNGRTFGAFDILKGTLLGVIAGTLTFLVYSHKRNTDYTLREREKNARQEATLNKFFSDIAFYNITPEAFYNAVNSELRELFYSEGSAYGDVIDFDIMDYNDQRLFTDEDGVKISVSLILRLIKNVNGAVTSEETENEIVIRKTAGGKSSDAAAVIKCPGCGMSVDITKRRCEYCGRTLEYVKPYTLVSFRTI